MIGLTIVLSLLVASADERVIKTYRKTMDGRLCASDYTIDQRDFAGCVTLSNPDGISGREW